MSGPGVAPRPLRIGVLGAARIVREALVLPSRRVLGIEVTAIAARDPARAHAAALRLGIPGVFASYEELLAAPEIDAVYVPLPSALHARWVVAAIQAGKHVLCEKPFTSNAQSAREVADLARGIAPVVMEAYHSHYHPLRHRLHEILDSGELGEIISAEAVACAPIPPGRDIRWQYELGGGGLLDVGYYPLRLLRELFGEARVVNAKARSRGDIDAEFQGRLEHSTGVASTIECSLWSRRLLASHLHVVGTKGRLRVGTPTHPQLGGLIRFSGQARRRVERPDRRSTYDFQLEAFRTAVVEGGPVQTGCPEAVAQLEAIDSLYANAGLARRPSHGA